MARWAVIGASGFVGSHLVATLRNREVEVTELRAPRLLSGAADAEDIGGHVDMLSEERKDLVEAISGHDVVVNAAGVAVPSAKRRAAASLIGANAVLPVLAARASTQASVRRFLHISSAAVQGRMNPLTGQAVYAPFSPYSWSKALGEEALIAETRRLPPSGSEVTILRATSVQGAGRQTTAALERFARSSFSSVAGAGSDPSPVSSIEQLVQWVSSLGESRQPLSLIAVQPWEGLTTAAVLRLYSGKEPLHLPPVVCRATVRSAFALAKLGLPVEALARRLEVLWFGQGIYQPKNEGSFE